MATGRHLKGLPLYIDCDDFQKFFYSLFVFNLNLEEGSQVLFPVSSENLEPRYYTRHSNDLRLLLYYFREKLQTTSVGVLLLRRIDNH